MPPLLLWAQAAPPKLPDWIQWLLVWGEPALTDARFFGALMTWAKVVGLFCLVGWIVVKVVSTLRSTAAGRIGGRTSGVNPQILAAVLFAFLFLGAVLLQVLDQLGRIKLGVIFGLPAGGVLVFSLGVLLLAWVEWVVWRGVAKNPRFGQFVLVSAMHLAFLLGFAVSFLIVRHTRTALNQGPFTALAWRDVVVNGARFGATYAGLVVLANIATLMVRELLSLRWRRIYAIAWQTIVESYRRMWAPWVVLALFIVILAFTNWFLGGQRTAELARLFVGTLAVVCSLLLTLMILILAPISIPNDIRQQTIYTIVSKPVRRLEMIWGRLLGYMVLVTAVVLVFGGISLAYLQRVVGGRITSTRVAAQEARENNRVDEARRLDEQADQLSARMSARVPIYGSLIFTDSKGKERIKGIDVGNEMVSRSHIEGASPSKATWRFGIVPDPMNPQVMVDTRIPVEQLLRQGSLEELENRLALLQDQKAEIQARLGAPDLKANESRTLNDDLKRVDEQVTRAEADLKELRQTERNLRVQARARDAEGKKSEAADLRRQAEDLHSPPIPIEMTFNVYRTTKGELGEAVRASVVVTSPRPGVTPARDLFPIHEYYTIRRSFPSRMLVGCKGYLRIDVQCVTPNQYLGMGQEDLYILSDQGPFWSNYLRGLTGIWLQALVLTSVGLFAGTFLSWPVALLLTLAFFLAGQVAVGFLQQIATSTLIGGGPFESLIRLLSHNNQMNDLDPTIGVIFAKTFDQIVMPFIGRLAYLIPNLSALDVSNTVAAGFAVGNRMLLEHLLMGLGYALPFTVAAYLILKNREVAA